MYARMDCIRIVMDRVTDVAIAAVSHRFLDRLILSTFLICTDVLPPSVW